MSRLDYVRDVTCTDMDIYDSCTQTVVERCVRSMGMSFVYMRVKLRKHEQNKWPWLPIRKRFSILLQPCRVTCDIALFEVNCSTIDTPDQAGNVCWYCHVRAMCNKLSNHILLQAIIVLNQAIRGFVAIKQPG